MAGPEHTRIHGLNYCDEGLFLRNFNDSSTFGDLERVLRGTVAGHLHASFRRKAGQARGSRTLRTFSLSGSLSYEGYESGPRS